MNVNVHIQTFVPKRLVVNVRDITEDPERAIEFRPLVVLGH